jgi:pimeloyl-ACP methyl ester carboxylesterase
MNPMNVFAAALVATLTLNALAASAPPPEAFTVMPLASPGPQITPYLKYQTEMAWRQDEMRRKTWQSIRTEQDLLRMQGQIRQKLLAMLGGLPATRTPLHPTITGRIPMQGFHIEKLIFESLPGVYVTALVYVPDDQKKNHPAVLVPPGHAPDGKAHYQALCQRLVRRGYVVICWDPVGQGERSQFWDKKAGKSRYNLICAEHAVLGNLAYLAGTNLARWEIWDGMRAVDYLLTRPDVDPNRINITGTSGGGFQAANIAALDHRIKVAIPSCYITALPMRVYNRIFKDPDSDPEQDLYGMISNGVDHPGLLLLMYPRPVFVAAAVLDFFPIEGTHQTFREVEDFYTRFHHADRIGMAEGFHGHQYSEQNQEAALEFMDRFNNFPAQQTLAPAVELDGKTLQCTGKGQVMLDFEDSRSLMDVIRDYYAEHKAQKGGPISQLYYGSGYPGVRTWAIDRDKYDGKTPTDNRIAWEAAGNSQFESIAIDRYALHHSHNLQMPLLHIHRANAHNRKVLLWFSQNGKASASDWPEIRKNLDLGYDIVTFDFRGLGETRMLYKAVSEDDPSLAQLDFDRAYLNPVSSVLADYVYNSLLTGRPYFLQMMEDAEIAAKFCRVILQAKELFVGSDGESYILASAISEAFPGTKLQPPPGAQSVKWSDLVERKLELWPIQFLLPGGAYIH